MGGIDMLVLGVVYAAKSEYRHQYHNKNINMQK